MRDFTQLFLDRDRADSQVLTGLESFDDSSCRLEASSIRTTEWSDLAVIHSQLTELLENVLACLECLLVSVVGEWRVKLVIQLASLRSFALRDF